ERRRRVRLTVERDAAVTAVVPPGVDRDELVKIVKSRRRRLYGKLAERRDLGEARPEREYVSGEGFPYLGRSHRLLIVDSAPSDVRLMILAARGAGHARLLRPTRPPQAPRPRPLAPLTRSTRPGGIRNRPRRGRRGRP